MKSEAFPFSLILNCTSKTFLGKVQLISAFGNDKNGKILKNRLPLRCREGSITIENCPTASCCVVLNESGECQLVVGDLSIHEKITFDLIVRNQNLLKSAPLIVIDGNLSYEAMAQVLMLAKRFEKPVFFEPTDLACAGKPFKVINEYTKQIKFISPNLNELRVIYKAFKLPEVKRESDDLDGKLKEIFEMCTFLKTHIENIIVTLGEHGVLITSPLPSSSPLLETNWGVYKNLAPENDAFMKYYPLPKFCFVENASGAGDAFAAGFISGMLRGLPERICVSVGFQAAELALKAKGAVPEKYFDFDHRCWSTPAKHMPIVDSGSRKAWLQVPL